MSNTRRIDCSLEAIARESGHRVAILATTARTAVRLYTLFIALFGRSICAILAERAGSVQFLGLFRSRNSGHVHRRQTSLPSLLDPSAELYNPFKREKVLIFQFCSC